MTFELIVPFQIAVTTHLFWHPVYTYERTRQIALLRLSALNFRSSLNLPSWPIIMAGDFNTPPTEPCYGLMMNPDGQLTSHMSEVLEVSRVVHDSVVRVGKRGVGEGKVGPPEFVPPGAMSKKLPEEGEGKETPEEDQEGNEEEDEDEGGGDSKGTGSTKEPLKNTRPPTTSDGILTLPELRQLLSQGRPRDESIPAVVSVYEEASRMLNRQLNEEETEELSQKRSKGKELLQGRLLGDRIPKDWELMGGDVGKHEPNWTSFTPLWHLTFVPTLSFWASNFFDCRSFRI